MENQGKNWDETFVDLTCVSGVVLLLLTLLFACDGNLSAAPVTLVDQSPVRISNAGPKVILVDFGREASQART